MRDIDRRLAGVLSLLGAAFALGWIGVFMRQIKGTPAPTVVFYRVLITALTLLLIARPRTPPQGRREWFTFLGFASLQAATYSFYLSAFRYTTVANVAFLHYLAPVFVLLLAPLVLKERIRGKLIFSLLMALAGTTLLTGWLTGGLHFSPGEGLAVCSALTYAGYTLMGRVVGAASDPRRTALWVHILALPMVVGFNLFSGEGGFVIASGDWLYVALLALLSTTLAFVLFFKGLQVIPASQATLVMLLSPVTNAVLGWWLLGETLAPQQLIGATLMLGAVVLAQSKVASWRLES